MRAAGRRAWQVRCAEPALRLDLWRIRFPPPMARGKRHDQKNRHAGNLGAVVFAFARENFALNKIRLVTKAPV